VVFLVRQVVFAALNDESAATLLHSGPRGGIKCDPGPVGLLNLEAIVTKRAFDEVLPEQREPVAIFNDGQRLVLGLNRRLRNELARLRWRAPSVVGRWGRSDEVRAEGLLPAQVQHLVLELCRLARGAVKDDRRLYMWVDVDERALFSSP
jgi:hypothetical protein